MSQTNFRTLMATIVAISFFSPSFTLAQTAPTGTPRKIQTPNTSQELKDAPAAAETPRAEAPAESEGGTIRTGETRGAAPRQLQQHGLGIGLGQTFLFGNYGKHGQDKITMDLLYSYAASYSFDLLVNAHYSEHTDNSEKMKLMGLTSSIKGRYFEFDNFSPFFLGGLGFYAPQARRDGLGSTTRKLGFGLNFGGGVDLRLNEKFVVGVMAQMHWPFKVAQDRGDDLKGYYMKLLLTGMYLF